jgi:glycosyltransferase involved in cell wall biosynthesis
VETFGATALAPLRRVGADVVHAFTPSGALAGRLARRPTVYTVLGHPHAEQFPSAPVPRALFRAAVGGATVTATLSAASADALWATTGRRAVVLPPGVRLERFAAHLTARHGPPRLLFAGSLTDRRKRADLAVAAFALLRARRPDARLALFGEGDATWALDAAPDEHTRAAIDVLGTGRAEDVGARYREATATLLPAEHEAFGLVLVESLACGTPVVCVPGGGMPEIVGDEPVGVVATTDAPRAVADALDVAIELAASAATASRCAARARRWAWEGAVGRAHEELYDALVRRRRVDELVSLTDVGGDHSAPLRPLLSARRGEITADDACARRSVS